MCVEGEFHNDCLNLNLICFSYFDIIYLGEYWFSKFFSLG